MQPRRGEGAAKDRVRSRRFIETDEGWYFKTREGIAVGPYPTEFDAEVCASLLTTHLSQLEDDADLSAVVQDFLGDPTSGPRSAQFRRIQVKNASELKPRRQATPQVLKAAVSDLWERARSAIFTK